jgi:hypothetical protein
LAIVIACAFTNRQLVRFIADELYDVRFGFADILIMSTSPPLHAVSLPQMVLGPLVMLALHGIARHDSSYNRLTRLQSCRQLWRKHSFWAILFSLSVSFASIVLIALLFPPREGFFGPTNFDSARSLCSALTSWQVSVSPSNAWVMLTCMFEGFQIVLLEAMLFLFLGRLCGNDALAFAVVLALASLSLVYVRLGALLQMGYFAFCDFEPLLYFSPLGVSGLLFLAGHLLPKREGLRKEGTYEH